jgi:hypothetical protein
VINSAGNNLDEMYAVFGRELMLWERPELAAKEVPKGVRVEKAKSWFQTESPALRKLFCTDGGRVRAEVTAAVALTVVVGAAIRAHYGENFPATEAAACLLAYGLDNYCARSSD